MNLPNLITVSPLVLTAAVLCCLEWIGDPVHPAPALVWIIRFRLIAFATKRQINHRTIVS